MPKAKTSSSAGDATGRKRDQLAREHAAELAERAQEMSLATAAAAEEESNTVVDYVDGGEFEDEGEPEIEVLGDEPIEDLGVEEVDDVAVVIRVNTDIEDMTFGAGNVMSFVAGRRYRVSKHIADHLEERQLVWHKFARTRQPIRFGLDELGTKRPSLPFGMCGTVFGRQG